MLRKPLSLFFTATALACDLHLHSHLTGPPRREPALLPVSKFFRCARVSTACLESTSDCVSFDPMEIFG